MGTPIGLDFTAVMMVAAARGADLELLADALPEAENAVLVGLSGDGGEDWSEND